MITPFPLTVGHSSDPEGLTSVDLVTVYTAPISDVDWRRGHRTRLSGRNSPISFSWPRSRRSGSLEWTAQTTCEFPLGCVHDMFNLEMHSNKRELNVCSSTCYRTPVSSMSFQLMPESVVRVYYVYLLRFPLVRNKFDIV